MTESLKDKLIGAALVFGGFLVALVAAFLLAVCFQPDCLGSAYMHSMPEWDRAVENFVVKAPRWDLKRKSREYLAWIANHKEVIK